MQDQGSNQGQQPLFSKQDFKKQEEITQELQKTVGTAIQKYLTHDRENITNKDLIIRSHIASEVLVNNLSTIIAGALFSFVDNENEHQNKIQEASKNIAADLQNKIQQDLLMVSNKGAGVTQ